MSSVISTTHLSKKFFSSEAVLDLNLDVPRASIFGYIGPNIELARPLGVHRFTIAAGTVCCYLHTVTCGFVNYGRVLGCSGRNFDFASLSFQVPMFGFSAAKLTADANMHSAVIKTILVVFMWSPHSGNKKFQLVRPKCTSGHF